MKVRMKMHYGWAVLALMTATTLMVSGCGGGDAPPAKTFPLHAALDALTAKGATFTLTATGTGAAATRAVDGDCSGTFTETDAPVQADTLKSVAVLSSAITVNFSALTCPTSTNTSQATVTETAYFDTAYVPLAALDSSGKYGHYVIAPVVPVTVKVGDQGTIGKLDFENSLTDTTSAGHSDWTYVIEPDSDTTAIAASISKQYDVAGTLTNTSELRYRIDTQGNLSVVSLVLVAGTGRLVFRCNANCALLP